MLTHYITVNLLPNNIRTQGLGRHLLGGHNFNDIFALTAQAFMVKDSYFRYSSLMSLVVSLSYNLFENIFK